MEKHLKEEIKATFLRNVEEKSLDDVGLWFTKSYRLYSSEKFCDFVSIFKTKSVRIIGDYDVDGICATSILLLGLKKAGFTNVSFRIPHRTDGFGLSEKLVDECINDKVKLIITCDNGISAIYPVKKAKENGIAVIITDHHQSVVDDDDNIILPEADIIINPSAIENSADYSHYCGAGICYKLMKELLSDSPLCNKLMVLAGIATIADVVPLREENYVLVRNALRKMSDFKNLTNGLSKLMYAIGISTPNEKDIAFKLSPVLNAAERMYPGTAKNIVNLLTAEENSSEIERLALEAIEINRQRKEEQKRLLSQAEKLIFQGNMQNIYPLVLYLPNEKEGLMGIIAGSLAEKYKVPTFILTDSVEPNVIKGSARTYGDISIKKELDAVQNILLKHGGHKEAGGLSLKKENLENLRDCLEINMIDYVAPTKTENSNYDIEILAKDIPEVLVEVMRYAPFGNKNPQIRFKIKDYTLSASYGKYATIFEDSKTIKLYSSIVDALGFGISDKVGEIKSPKILNLYGTLNRGCNLYTKKHETTIEFDNFEFVEKKKQQTTLATSMLSI